MFRELIIVFGNMYILGLINNLANETKKYILIFFF